MKIALIAGGLIDIPPQKHGAIEKILWNYKLELEKKGNQVVIFNSQNLHLVASQINNGDFDFVQLNYSEYVGFFLKNLGVPFCVTCHSGYITNQKKWSLGYYSVFYDTLKCPGIIALSEDIQKLYLDNGYQGFIRVIRNGVDTKDFKLIEKGNGRAVCLGRIEPRKRQAWLANILAQKVNLDFIGPIKDQTFKAEERCRYIGYWSKDEVHKNLTDYSCLVLLSDGEAAPLVVPEALAAGLSIVVSRSASANLDVNLPFVTILPDDIYDPAIIARAINEQVKNNSVCRPQIVKYAQDYFDNTAVIADYIKVAKEFKNTDHKVKYNQPIPWGKLPIYLLSRLIILTKDLLRNFKQSLKLKPEK